MQHAIWTRVSANRGFIRHNNRKLKKKAKRNARRCPADMVWSLSPRRLSAATAPCPRVVNSDMYPQRHQSEYEKCVWICVLPPFASTCIVKILLGLLGRLCTCVAFLFISRMAFACVVINNKVSFLCASCYLCCVRVAFQYDHVHM